MTALSSHAGEAAAAADVLGRGPPAFAAIPDAAAVVDAVGVSAAAAPTALGDVRPAVSGLEGLGGLSAITHTYAPGFQEAA